LRFMASGTYILIDSAGICHVKLQQLLTDSTVLQLNVIFCTFVD
jgi:hypothetical protein